RKVGIACVSAHRCGFSHEVALNLRFRSSLRRIGSAESGSNLRRDDLVDQCVQHHFCAAPLVCNISCLQHHWPDETGVAV
ncbi:MAG TPA: hypothetical protein VMX97_18320, partial [Hyphomicrobiaceae bacterium]|nr:hypothetical protein [Hyphomicrobiaceae bacterium]